jgi:hypothetical protein
MLNLLDTKVLKRNKVDVDVDVIDRSFNLGGMRRDIQHKHFFELNILLLVRALWFIHVSNHSLRRSKITVSKRVQVISNHIC